MVGTRVGTGRREGKEGTAKLDGSVARSRGKWIRTPALPSSKDRKTVLEKAEAAPQRTNPAAL